MSELVVVIRPERPEDRVRVHEIVAAAFESEVEAELVEKMRGRVEPEVSLVAESDGELVGHVYFSPVRVGDDERLAMDPKCLVTDRDSRRRPKRRLGVPQEERDKNDETGGDDEKGSAPPE